MKIKMIRNKKTCFGLLILMLFLINVFIVTAKITVDLKVKDSFGLGDKTQFDYSISSDYAQDIIFTPHILCPDAPVSPIQEKTANIKPGTPYSETYYDLIVDESLNPQTCTAYVQILSPAQQTFSKQFTIVTDPSFSFSINTCKDASCAEESKVFLKNDEIYLDYLSELQDLSITATLTYPDKTTKQMSLPSLIKADQSGTYALDVTASKQGYKTINVQEQFGVIEEEPEIEALTVCNSNSVCDNGEDWQSCPQDCVRKGKLRLVIYASAIIILIIIIILIAYFIRRNRVENIAP